MKIIDILILLAMITLFILGLVFAFLSFQSFDWIFISLSVLFLFSGFILKMEFNHR